MKYAKPSHFVLQRWILRVLSTLAVIGRSLLADTVTNRPIADAEIRKFSPATNFGTDSTVVSGGLGSSAGNETRRAVLKFDLAGKIPATATINSVTLTVTVTKVPSGPANSTFDLRQLLQDWSETGVTWTSRLSPQPPWSVPGATGAADSSGTASSSVLVSGVGRYTFPSTSTLVSNVQDWVNNPSSNFGWLLMSRSENVLKTARHFASRESVASAPTLVLNFTVPQTAPLTIESSSPLPNGTVGVSYSFTMTATNGTPPLSWSAISGTPPGGIDLSSAGELTGTPTNAGDFNFTAQVMDNAGAVTNKAFVLTISPPLRFDQFNVAGNQIQIQFAAQAGQPYTIDVRASLSAGDWLTLTNIAAQPITAAVTITDLISEASRFYRLRTP